jgi:hypothetical protein
MRPSPIANLIEKKRRFRRVFAANTLTRFKYFLAALPFS